MRATDPAGNTDPTAARDQFEVLDRGAAAAGDRSLELGRMSSENVETLRAGIDAFNRRDLDAALALVRDDVTWERFVSRTESNDPMVRGKEELLSVWRAQVDMIDIRLDPQDVVPAGDDKVIARIRMSARGMQSEVALSSVVTWMWTFDERGLVRTVETFDSVEEAMKAAAGG